MANLYKLKSVKTITKFKKVSRALIKSWKRGSTAQKRFCLYFERVFKGRKLIMKIGNWRHAKIRQNTRR